MSNNITYIGSDVFTDTKYFKKNFNWGYGFLYIGKYLISSRSAWWTEIKYGAELIADCANVVLCRENKQEKLLLPNTLKYIGNKAFERLHFEEIVIPESVVYIGHGAFEHCLALRKITIPESVILMGDIFGSSSLIKDRVTIKCKIGSEAYEYAKANDIRCDAIY